MHYPKEDVVGSQKESQARQRENPEDGRKFKLGYEKTTLTNKKSGVGTRAYTKKKHQHFR